MARKPTETVAAQLAETSDIVAAGAKSARKVRTLDDELRAMRDCWEKLATLPLEAAERAINYLMAKHNERVNREDSHFQPPKESHNGTGA